MSDLYNKINGILSGATSQPTDVSYLLEDWQNRATFEKVKLFEAKRTLNTVNPGKEQVARMMVELAGTANTTNVERDPDGAMVVSTQLFRTDSHLSESWKVMGKLIETAHEQFGLDLKEAIGKYNESQVNLLEVSLQLPWRLNYSEPTPIEHHDYPVPQDADIWKGETVDDEVTDENDAEAEIAAESKINKLRQKLKESKKSQLDEDTATALMTQFVKAQGSAEKALMKLVKDWTKSRQYASAMRDYLKDNS